MHVRPQVQLDGRFAWKNLYLGSCQSSSRFWIIPTLALTAGRRWTRRASVRMRYRSNATAASTSGRCTLMATSPPPSPASRPRYTCRMPDRVYSTVIERSLETLAQGGCPLENTH